MSGIESWIDQCREASRECDRIRESINNSLEDVLLGYVLVWRIGEDGKDIVFQYWTNRDFGDEG